ncbi:MAG: A/G-specific adenine glycosylase, partial [Alphaproteobacteria bacterium]
MVDGVPGGRESLSSCHLPEGRPLLEPAMIADLLNWFARYRRHDLPWRRTRPDGRRDPWRVWLAEIMLQQTTVATVAARFDSFLTRFPDVFSLASAGEEEVMEAWAGLGYYARARHLHHAAQRIVEKWGGNFPRTFDEWAQLPGIGSYSAAAIAAIAFGEPVLPVDIN